MFWCAVVATFLILAALWRLYLHQRVDFKTRYGCEYVVITGATGGVGGALIQEIKKQNLNLILVARNSGELQKLKEANESEATKILTFVFDFASDLSKFAPLFGEFLAENWISVDQIGVCYSNAGFGEYNAFDSSDFAHKQRFLKVNVDSHVAVADYFLRLFKLREGKRSGLIFTSSALSHTPGQYFALYHAAKACLSALGNSLFAEYRWQKIDVLTVNPSAISNTKFYQHADIKQPSGEKMPVIGGIEHSVISVTPEQVAFHMVSRIGKVSQTNVGWAAKGTAMLGMLGRNFSGHAWAHFSMNNKIVRKRD